MYTRVYVEITNVCNMSCSFCHGHSRAPKSMTEEEFKIVLRELQGKTKHIYYHLMGEPLLHKDLAKFLALAKENGFRSLITTNGTLLAKWGDELLNCGVNSTENNVRPGKKENKLIESSIYKMNISLHSFEDQGQEYLTKYLSDVVDFVEKAKNHHIIIVLRLWNKGSENAFDQEIISFLRSRLDGEWTENENGFKIRNRLHISWSEPFGWPDINGEYLGDEVSCYGTRDHFGILADGTVVPCCLDSEGAIPLGNVFKEALEDILSSPRTMSIMQGFGMRKAVEELCKRCPYARKF